MAIRVNGELVADDVFHRAFVRLSHGRTPGQVQTESASEYARLKQLAEHSVLEHVLLQQLARSEDLTVTSAEVEAERRRILKDDAPKVSSIGLRDDLREHLIRIKVERHITRHVPRPGAAEVEQVYSANREAYRQPERVNASQIFCRAETARERLAASRKLQTAAADLNSGGSFQQVAFKFSDCAGKGTALGWIQRGELIEKLEKVLFTLSAGKHSSVLETVFGFHILIVLQHKTMGYQSLAEVRPALAKQILEERRQALIARTVQQASLLACIDFSPSLSQEAI